MRRLVSWFDPSGLATPSTPNTSRAMTPASSGETAVAGGVSPQNFAVTRRS